MSNCTVDIKQLIKDILLKLINEDEEIRNSIKNICDLSLEENISSLPNNIYKI